MVLIYKVIRLIGFKTIIMLASSSKQSYDVDCGVWTGSGLALSIHNQSITTLYPILLPHLTCVAYIDFKL